MKKFFQKSGPGGWKSGNKFGGGFGGGRSFGRRDDRGPAEMHEATCNECRKSCQVPFKPNGRKPVYCSDCFKRDEGGERERPQYGERERPQYGERERPQFGSRFEHSSFDEKRMHTATCDTCGNSCEVPFRPTGKKPIYCHNCFGKNAGSAPMAMANNGGNSGNTAHLEAELKRINEKLDAIIEVLNEAAALDEGEEEATS